ncbi:S-layer homology domain-containing protein [Paenibacillus tarimensis]
MMAIVTPVSAEAFHDTQNHWGRSAIEKWEKYGVVNGYAGSFRPNDSVTRAELSVMINNIMKYLVKGDNTFPDLAPDQWYSDAMLKLNAAGVVTGSNGKALPNNKVSRQEAAVMIARAFKIDEGTGSLLFKDDADIAEWAQGAVNALVSKEIIAGMPDGNFRPLSDLTRAEAVTLLDNLIKELIAAPGEYSQDITGNAVVNSSDVFLKDMTISGDLYIAQGVGDGEVTLDNVEISGTVYVLGGGENSIIFNNVDVKGALVVNRYNGKVRILATGSTSVSVTVLESGAMLVTKELTGGGFETVEISADILAGQTVVLDGNFNKVTNQSSTANIKANGKINELIANANTHITGEVTVAKLTKADGAAATVNDKNIQPAGQSNSNPPSYSAPSTGGGTPTNDGEPTGSDEGSQEPDNGSQDPDDGSQDPDDGSQDPDNGSKDPDDGSQDPDDGSQDPDDGSQDPDDGSQDPDNGSQDPDDGSSDPGIVTADDVFAAIETKFLANNVGLNNIVSDMSLMTSLSEYPDVTIAWDSDNEAVISEQGSVTRSSQDDQFVTLSATLSGNITGTKSYQAIVRALGMDLVENSEYIDPYFEAGYPQAFIKEGKIWVKYKLKTAAEVFMVVNAINGHFKSDVKSVLEGHAGENDIIYVNDWPYFKVDESIVNEIQEFNTGVQVTSYTSARVEFVIQDKSGNYTSEEVTTVLFDPTAIAALDTYPPVSYSMFVNKALDAIYIYYNESLDSDSVPQPSDFTLNHGTVNGVTIKNFSGFGGLASSVVKLEVSGLPEAEKNNLQLSYSGDAIQDLTDARNKAESFAARSVSYIEEKIESATISSDRMSMIVQLYPGWNPKENNVNITDPSRVTIAVGETAGYTAASVTYGYSSDSLTYRLTFDSPLPEGDVTFKLNTSGIKNWALDDYPSELVTQTVTAIPAPGAPAATYTQNSGELKLTFAEGFEIDWSSYNAGGFVLKVDGAEYSLRGYIIRRDYTDSNAVIIDLSDKYSWLYKEAIDQGADIQIKYTRGYDSRWGQLVDRAGAFVPDFDYLEVTKQP